MPLNAHSKAALGFKSTSVGSWDVLLTLTFMTSTACEVRPMPTNRTRIKRAVRSRVTDEARAIYAEALKLRDVHREHTLGMCPTAGKHCGDCTKYTELRRELGRLVGVKFWECSPLEADCAPGAGFGSCTRGETSIRIVAARHRAGVV